MFSEGRLRYGINMFRSVFMFIIAVSFLVASSGVSNAFGTGSVCSELSNSNPFALHFTEHKTGGESGLGTSAHSHCGIDFLTAVLQTAPYDHTLSREFLWSENGVSFGEDPSPYLGPPRHRI